MSVIAIRAFKNHVHIATDSCVSYGDTTYARGQHLEDSKLFVVGDVAVAFVGTSMLSSILRRFVIANPLTDVGENAIVDYVDRFNAYRRDSFPDSGEISEMSWVIALNGRAWVVDGYSASYVPPGGYFAHGSGMDIALGALYAGAPVEGAVEAACVHSSGCGLPVQRVTISEYARPDIETVGLTVVQAKEAA